MKIDNNAKYTYAYDELGTATDKAWNVKIEGDWYWLPKSQCELDETTGTVQIPGWLVAKNELPVEE